MIINVEDVELMDKKIKKNIESILNLSARKLSLLVLYLYFSFVFIGQYIIGVSFDLIIWIVPIILFGAVIATIVTDKICHFIGRIDTHKIGTKRELKTWFIICFTVTLGVLMVYYYVFFPGAFSPDSNNQLSQSISGIYSDRHPFIHTFLFFTIPMSIFNAEEIIVFLQILYFSAALAYLIMTIKRYGSPRWICALGVLFVLAAPVTGNILMYPWKDCGLAIFSMVTMAHYLNIILSHGEWLQKKRNIIMCGIFFVLTMLVRHNAILFIFPMMMTLLITGWNKYRPKVLSIIVIVSIVTLFIKVPIHWIYKVEKPGDRVIETTGMCMVIMGNVIKNCPEVLSDEIRNFLYEVSPQEVWEETYETGDFNSVKWHPETDKEMIDKAGVTKLLKYTFKTFRASETYSIQAFLQLTGMIWKLDGDLNWRIGAFADTEKTEQILNTAKQRKMALMLRNWKTYMDKSVLKYPMNYIGWFNLTLIALALSNINKKEDWIHIFHALPLLCYNFGTALLLTGFDWRFFYLNFPLIVPTAFVLIKDVQGGYE